jgi:hypothetical protein
MIYVYDIPTRPRRLALTAADTPSLSIPVAPDLYDAVVAFLTHHGETWGMQRIHHALRQAVALPFTTAEDARTLALTTPPRQRGAYAVAQEKLSIEQSITALFAYESRIEAGVHAGNTGSAGLPPGECAPYRLSRYIGEILGARQFTHCGIGTCDDCQKLRLNEKLGIGCARGRNAEKSLSDCRLNKQRLIDSLGAKANESAGLIKRTEVTPPYKKSRFHRGSLLPLRCPWEPGKAT